MGARTDSICRIARGGIKIGLVGGARLMTQGARHGIFVRVADYLSPDFHWLNNMLLPFNMFA